MFSPTAAPSMEETSKFVEVSNDKLFATFVLSKGHVQRVKDVVAAEASERGVATPPRCSSLVATLGFFWSCYRRARPGGGGSGRTCLLFSVDHRSRLKPRLPDTYFENCIRPAIAVASTGHLTETRTGGLFAACAAVAAAIEEAVSIIGTESEDLPKERFKEMGLLEVAGSPRFCVYKLDFGLGRPAKVDIVSVVKTCAIALAESRDGASGSMEVGVSLPPDRMDEFRKCFADATARLDVRVGGSSVANVT